ncbi:MAG: thioredoxin family protein [Acidobacteria bacterium]|nr:MAG: thioredoxin family protein [Acidobacteriota bacterium]
MSRLAHQAAVESRQVDAEVVEITEFPDIARRHGVTSVPKLVINDSVEFLGSLTEERFITALTLVPRQ